MYFHSWPDWAGLQSVMEKGLGFPVMDYFFFNVQHNG